eukprot:9474044-Pyramimonas_sp.AAC.1
MGKCRNIPLHGAEAPCNICFGDTLQRRSSTTGLRLAFAGPLRSSVLPPLAHEVSACPRVCSALVRLLAQ